MNTITKKTRRNFTIEDDNIIIEFIKKSPTNISHAFQQAAEKLDINFNTISSRYYSTIRKKNTIVTCGSSAGMSSNVKNVARKDGKLESAQLQPHLVVLRQLIDLPKNQRDLILNLFK